VNRGSTVAGDATGSPHSKQNFAPAGSSLRHFVQVSATRAPHSRQNFACGGFSCWHREHFIAESPVDRAWRWGRGDDSLCVPTASIRTTAQKIRSAVVRAHAAGSSVTRGALALEEVDRANSWLIRNA
jgi:hypothetical protein